MTQPLPDNGRPVQQGDNSFVYQDVYHPIHWYGGEPYRPRVETLVIKDGRYVFLKMYSDDEIKKEERLSPYELPGGSIDNDCDKLTQAENEVNEEILVKVKNTYQTNIQYYETFSDKNVEEFKKHSPLSYRGFMSEVFCAEYDGKFNAKNVAEKDLDPEMQKGKFHPIALVADKLSTPHMEALLNCPFVDNSIKMTLRLYYNKKQVTESYVTEVRGQLQNTDRTYSFPVKLGGDDEYMVVNTHRINLSKPTFGLILIDVIYSLLKSRIDLSLTSLFALPTFASQYFALDIFTPDMKSGGSVISVDDGEVVVVKTNTFNVAINKEIKNTLSLFGNCVVVKHDNLTYSLYAHLESTSVKPGDNVKRGETIGVLGNTGNSSGPHLHFQMCVINPKIAIELGIFSQLVPMASGLTSKQVNFDDVYVKQLKMSYYKSCKDYKDVYDKASYELENTDFTPSEDIDFSNDKYINVVCKSRGTNRIPSLGRKPIYVVSMRYNSVFAGAVRAYTKSEYNHSAIALDNSLDEMYTFVRDRTTTENSTPNGFSIETIDSMITKDINTTIKVVKFYVPEDGYNALYEKISHHKRSNRTSYDFKNIMRVPLGIEKETDDGKFVCSTFVADSVESLGIKLPKPINLMTPSDIANLKGGEVVYTGRLDKYSIRPEMESTFVSETKRSELPDNEFGVPEERKYPLDSEKHVRSAIKLFNHVDKEYEAELAKKIIDKMEEYDIKDINIGPNNRLSKYIKEGFIMEASKPKKKKTSYKAYTLKEAEIIAEKLIKDPNPAIQSFGHSIKHGVLHGFDNFVDILGKINGLFYAGVVLTPYLFSIIMSTVLLLVASLPFVLISGALQKQKRFLRNAISKEDKYLAKYNEMLDKIIRSEGASGVVGLTESFSIVLEAPGDDEDDEGVEEDDLEDTEDAEDEETAEEDEVTDYTDEADDEEPIEEEPEEDVEPDEDDDVTDYTEEVDDDEPMDDEPAEASEDDGLDDVTDYSEDIGDDDETTDTAIEGDTDDDTSVDEPTDYSDEESDTPEDDETGEELEDGEEPVDDVDSSTDYTDDSTMDDASGEDADTDMDSDTSSEDEMSEQNGKSNQNNIVKNYNLILDFQNLYRLLGEITTNLEATVFKSPIQNVALTQIVKNMKRIKESVSNYIEFNFGSDYTTNLYNYNIFIKALKLNLEMLQTTKDLITDTKNK